MGAIVIPNQAVSIWETEDFNTKQKRCVQEYQQFCQIVRTGDITMFQVQLTDHTGDNLLNNPDFDSDLSSWGYVPGTWEWLNYSGLGVAGCLTNGIDNALYQSFSVEANTTYKITIGVTDTNGGTVYSQMNTIFGTVENSGTQTISKAGTIEYYAHFSSAGAGTIWIWSENTEDPMYKAYIDSVDIVKLTSPVVTLQDCDGNDIATITDKQFYKDLMTVRVNWLSSYDSGCYRVCLSGLEDLSNNYVLDGLCVGQENYASILQENGFCIKWIG